MTVRARANQIATRSHTPSTNLQNDFGVFFTKRFGLAESSVDSVPTSDPHRLYTPHASPAQAVHTRRRATPPYRPSRRVIPDRLQLLLNKTIPSKIRITETITASGRFAEGLPTTLRDDWGPSMTKITTRFRHRSAQFGLVEYEYHSGNTYKPSRTQRADP